MSFLQRRREEIEMYLQRDPVARNALEVIFCYPGLHAIWFHRITHRLWGWGWCWLARFLAYYVRIFTGIEIHPAAILGQRIFIDHGMGIVIGGSAEIGNDCSIYQGVTLGGTTQTFRGKRHPTLEEGVIVGAGAKILGPIIIGAGARIGSNAVVVRQVPSGCTAVGIPARILGIPEDSSSSQFSAYAVDEKSESCEDMIETLSAKVAELEKQIAEIKKGQ